MMADMRLIDANALMKKIAHHTVHDSLKRITFEAANTYEQVKGDMFALVQKAPVVDAAPVVHGRWELVDAAEPQRYGCSNCSCLSWYGTYRYCPSCGAKMDLEEQHD